METWDAVETVERIRKGDVSAAEVLEATISRAEGAGALNAIVTDTYERARARVAAAKPVDGAFAGLPTFLKDLSQLKGVATGWGSTGAAGIVSKKSDPFVKRLERTGMLVVGKSSTPEFGMTATTEPLCRGATRNPWDTSRSSGGSSGGAAALVAAGVVPLALASDGGGSIRIPAALCGLIGLKRTRGLLDAEGSSLLPVNVAVHGCVTRTVRDTIAFHRAMSGLGEIAPAPPRALRLGLYIDAPTGTPVDPQVQAAVRAAGRACEAMGHEVVEIACPFPAQVIDDFLTYWGFLAWIQSKTARLMLHRGFDKTKIEPWTRGLADSFTADRRRAFGAIRRLRRFTKAYAEVLTRYDVLVSPSAATPAPPLGHLATDLPYETHYDRVRTFAAFTPLHNAAGAPAISLPLGRTTTGLPLGVQFAAARGQDALLLELAQTLEQAHPWPRAPGSAHRSA
jgi:amidase